MLGRGSLNVVWSTIVLVFITPIYIILKNGFHVKLALLFHIGSYLNYEKQMLLVNHNKVEIAMEYVINVRRQG